MFSFLKIIELILAILGIYFIILRILAAIIYAKVNKYAVEQNQKASRIVNPPKYIITENCPICGSNNIDIFEEYIVNKEGEKILEGYSISCLYCGLQSPVLDSMEQCIDYWNIRDHEKTHDWVAGEFEAYSKEDIDGQEVGQVVSISETNNKSASVKDDNL